MTCRKFLERSSLFISGNTHDKPGPISEASTKEMVVVATGGGGSISNVRVILGGGSSSSISLSLVFDPELDSWISCGDIWEVTDLEGADDEFCLHLQVTRTYLRKE